MDRKFLVSSFTGIALGILSYVSIQVAYADCALPRLSLEIERAEVNSVVVDVQESGWPETAGMDSDIVSFFSVPDHSALCFETEDLWEK